MQNVLVVEDDALAVRSLVRLLRLNGLHAECVSSKSAALRAIRREGAYSSFLIDVHLSPRPNEGVEVLEHATKLFPVAPRALISGGLDRYVLNRAQSLGAMFICKPFGADDLRRFAYESLSTTIEDAEIRDSVVAWGMAVGLTPKQQEVLALMAAGRTRDECRAEACVVEATLAAHIRAILANASVADVPAESMAALVTWLVRRARIRKGVEARCTR